MTDQWRKQYDEDAIFRRAVDMFGALIRDVTLTPGELRAALMLAVYREEMWNPKPMVFRLEGLAADLVEDQRARLVSSAGRGRQGMEPKSPPIPTPVEGKAGE